jgi:hypothetical protein
VTPGQSNRKRGSVVAGRERKVGIAGSFMSAQNGHFTRKRFVPLYVFAKMRRGAANAVWRFSNLP